MCRAKATAGRIGTTSRCFRPKSCSISQPVAWVLAESLEAAQRGAARVVAEYAPLPAILTIEEAIAADSFLTEELRIHDGDLHALDSSPVRVKGELRIGGQEHFYLETQAALAWLDEAGFMAVHSSTQHPSETQEIVARVLGVPRNHVTVECLRMGGAFGGKEVQANPYAAIAALGTWKTKRPVRVRLTRELDMAITGKRHPYLVEVRGRTQTRRPAHRRSHRVVFGRGMEPRPVRAGDVAVDVSCRQCLQAAGRRRHRPCVPDAQDVADGVSRIRRTAGHARRSRKCSGSAAQALNLPADIVRQRNFYREGDDTHYGERVRDAGRIEAIWNALKASSDYDNRRSEIAQFNARSRHHKRGLAITPVKFGISFTATFFNQAGAVVLVYRDGTVQVNHGGTEMGQGLFTKILQVAADSLGVPALAGSRHVDAHRQSAEHVGDGRFVRQRSERRRGRGCVRADQDEAGCGRGRRSRLRAVRSAVRGRHGLGARQSRSSLRRSARPPTSSACRCSPKGFIGRRTSTSISRQHAADPSTITRTARRCRRSSWTALPDSVRLIRTDILHDVGDSISPVVDRGPNRRRVPPGRWLADD